MHKMIAAVTDTSYYSNEFKKNISEVLSEEEVADMRPESVILMCTGSQGETRSALHRLARGENKKIKMGKQDVVLFSSKVIPGNELEIREMQNLLIKKGVEVVATDTEDDIHVSGHPSKNSLCKMYEWINPKTFIPIHGDARMLYAHKKFAEECGIRNAIVIESGDVVRCKDGQIAKIGHQKTGLNAVDGPYLLPLEAQEIQDRSVMACNGHICVGFTLTKKNKLDKKPIISIVGVYIDKDKLKQIEKEINKIITNELNKDNNIPLETRCATDIRKLFAKQLDKRPIVTIQIHRT
jgi:ribonuclease J